MDKEFLNSIGISDEAADSIISKLSDEMGSMHIDFELQKEFYKRGVKSVDAAMKLIDKSTITYQDGEVLGITESIDKFQKENDFLFNEKKPKPVFSSVSKHEGGLTKQEFEKMGYEGRLKLFNESPELYKKLTNN